ncbi:hypothetical protein QQ020_31675 [Fulvivirgaceae bacterium BMA12]|uniref:Uncharacterized protein n=1 Tax=Agaribacillus aureus TaxID=3051825 RepID=A0ABT8LFV0_9BACT|nr:hypothetical protein [Fulvivirgaceae bacterium BMA12]
MKTLKLVLLLASIVFASCSDKDEEPAPVGPSLSYSETNFSSTYRSTGNSGLPALNWNGEVGNISLSGGQHGIYINDDNGTLHWNKYLAPGTYKVTAVATNSSGQATVEIEVENEFMGYFEGGLNANPASTTLTNDMTIDFKADGTAIVNVGFNGVGSWTRDESTVTAVVSFDGGTNFITFEGELSSNSSPAWLKGFYYNGQQAIEANKLGYFAVKID